MPLYNHPNQQQVGPLVQQIVASLAPHIKMHPLREEFASLSPNERSFNDHKSSGEGYFLGNWRLLLRSRIVCAICLSEIGPKDVLAMPRAQCDDGPCEVNKYICSELKNITQKRFYYIRQLLN